MFLLPHGPAHAGIITASAAAPLSGVCCRQRHCALAPDSLFGMLDGKTVPGTLRTGRVRRGLTVFSLADM